MSGIQPLAAAAGGEGGGVTPEELDAAVAAEAGLRIANDALKAPLASPAFTGTPTGITKAHVGLGNADNTSDANKPVSTAQATADALALPKTGGTMSGPIAMGGAKVTGLGAPSDAGDAMVVPASVAAGDEFVWNGTTLVRSAIGTAGQRARVNAGATAREWADPTIYDVIASIPAASAVLSGVRFFATDTLRAYVCQLTTVGTYAWQPTLGPGGLMSAACWADAVADWRLYGVARGATTIANSNNPGVYTLSVPSGGTYSARDLLGVTDPLGRFDGGWQVTDQAAPIAGGSTLGISGGGTSGDRLEPAGAFSVVAWCCPLMINTNTAFFRYIVMRRKDSATWGGGTTEAASLAHGAQGDWRPVATLLDNTTVRSVKAARAVPPGRLTQIAMTLSGATGTLTLYVDGVSQGTATVTSGVAWGSGTDRPWCLGANTSGASPAWAQEFPGSVHRAGVWTRALTAAELLADVRAVMG